MSYLISVQNNEAPYEVAANEPVKEVLQQSHHANNNNAALDPEVAGRAPWKRNLGIGLAILIILILIVRYSILFS